MASHSQHPAGIAHAGPSAALQAGTKVQVGKYIVKIEKFLSQGGFSHVYVASLVSPSYIKGFPTTQDRFVLKRMAVPDKDGLASVRKEVDVMKQLRPHKHVVYFIEASASSLPGGRGYEIFILMEYCPGGGIIDLLNSRLQNRLTESEILKIFCDTCEAVAHMHSQYPILVHRDLKVENILVATPNLYKLCDFGSTTNPLPHPPQTTQECQALEADLNKFTTLQYRAPEMIDVYSRNGVDEKADIWALGVFLYKLCYYTTPFEEQGPLAILNVQYKFPPYPAYSEQIKRLISTMLQELGQSRPDVWQVHQETCKLRGVSSRLVKPASATSATRIAPTSSNTASIHPTPNNLDSILVSGPISPPAIVSTDSIVPMRRGRPAKSKDAAVMEKASEVAPADSSNSAFSKANDVEGATSAPGFGKLIGPSSSDGPPNEMDLMAREAAAGFGNSFASPSQVLRTGASISTFSDSFDVAQGTAPTFLKPQGTAHGLRPTPAPSRGPSVGSQDQHSKSPLFEIDKQKAASPPSFPDPTNHKALSPTALATQAKVSATVATAAKAIGAQAPSVMGSLDTKPALRKNSGPPGNWRNLKSPEVVNRSSQTSPGLFQSPSSLSGLASTKKASPSNIAPLDLLGDDLENFGSLSHPRLPSIVPKPVSLTSKQYSAPTPVSAKAVNQVKPQLPVAMKDACNAPSPAPKSGLSGILNASSRAPASGSLSSDTSDEEPERVDGRSAYRPSRKSAANKPNPTLAHLNPILNTHPQVSKPVLPSTNPPASSTAILNQTSGSLSFNFARVGVHSKPTAPSAAMSNEGYSKLLVERKDSSTKFAPPPNAQPLPGLVTAFGDDDRDPFSSRAGARSKSPDVVRAGGEKWMGPPLKAPKPRSLKYNAAISNLVSRYDTISVASDRDKNKSPAIRAVVSPAKAKPAVSASNAGGSASALLRRASASSTTSGQSPSVDNFSRRFPDFEVVSSGGLNSASGLNSNSIASNTSHTLRKPFKPVTKSVSPPKTSTGVIKHAHIPHASLGPVQSFTNPNTKPGSNVRQDNRINGEDEDEEDAFQGVSNMKSRWESGALKRADVKTQGPRTDYGQTA